MRQLKVEWKKWAGLPDLSLDKLHDTLAATPKTDRMLRNDAGTDEALAGLHIHADADYVWPYHLHASIGPSCAVADVTAEKAEVWSGTQNPHDLRKDLAKLLDRAPEQVHINRMEASGCYGRNCADDVSADALLLSQAVGKPVRVQLMREQESGWEPKGTGQLIRVRGGLDKQLQVAAYELKTSYPSNNAVTLPLVLTGKVPNTADVQQMGDRTAIPQYEYPHMRVLSQDAAPIVRASWMRGVSALPNVFAHESWIDEMAYLAGRDPIAYRLQYLKDDRAIKLIAALKKQCNWQDGPAHRQPAPANQEVVTGRGFAYARYFHSKFPGFGAAWAAWVCDLSVNRKTGQIKIDKIFVAHDCGRMINPAGVKHQVHGNIIQSTSRVLKEFATFDGAGTTSLEWGGYPILRFDELPQVDIQLLDYPDEPPMGAGESASVPSAAAVGNALFDALGVRMREVPFTPERVLKALESAAQVKEDKA
jgi:CO/xanthine dehydrogenase Mo-binding subunit